MQVEEACICDGALLKHYITTSRRQRNEKDHCGPANVGGPSSKDRMENLIGR